MHKDIVISLFLVRSIQSPLGLISRESSVSNLGEEIIIIVLEWCCRAPSSRSGTLQILLIINKNMKEVFSKEVAQELGYQKYYPELKDWLLGLGIVLLVTAAFVGLLLLLINN